SPNLTSHPTRRSSDLGDVIAAADWIYRNAFSTNIRVANFSLRSSFPDYAGYDPIDAAVRRLWLNGTVVVASAGNNGSGRMLYARSEEHTSELQSRVDL